MKIGLVAMSGVRTQNEELLRLGLTLPGFVERSEVIASLPSLGLLTLAALTPDEFEVEYVEVAELKAAQRLPGDCDLVAISTYSAQAFEAYELADRLRKEGVPVVMGGLHVSACPDEAQQHCTSVVVGEGEPLWPQLLADFRSGRLQPRYLQAPLGSYDLADSPVPRFELLDPGKYNRLTVQTSRGCPHRCEFCASSVLLSPRYKVKPVAKVMEEIQAIKRIWDRPFIEFADDNSFADRAHYKQLLRALAPEKIRWFTEADIAIGRDDELLDLMRRSGCRQVLIGLESPREASLDGIELNANWKLRQRGGYEEAIARIQSHGIAVIGCFVFGLDGDTAEVFDEVRVFAERSGLRDVQITFMTPFPGTRLYHRLKAEGRILRDGAWDLCTLFDINVRPRSMTVDELQRGMLALSKDLYSAEPTRRRRQRFREMVRQSVRRSRQRSAPKEAPY